MVTKKFENKINKIRKLKIEQNLKNVILKKILVADYLIIILFIFKNLNGKKIS